ncbi:vWA domain-containing protein [Rubeoparvulum massiliense]|uniref:vWA domain-containing protein n=1 Tax=Rubeoparvulum massiliense TaxID=1631346 RepID=UPI00065DECB9|nr:VWA domain-containing protein [Rubeoparvulum massiliense]
MGRITLRQILCLTDGGSNQGDSPVTAAQYARELGITVNVIGIVDRKHMTPQEEQEIAEIAKAGGGISQIVGVQQLTQTVQMVTRQAMNQTITNVVQQELKEILGEGSLAVLPPAQRGEVIERVNDLGEMANLQVLILIDTSASMKSKMSAIQHALRDFQLSLESRAGVSRWAVYTYPGKKEVITEQVAWCEDMNQLTHLASKLEMSGLTPTGPAIQSAIKYFESGTSRLPTGEWDDEGRLNDHVI